VVAVAVVAHKTLPLFLKLQLLQPLLLYLMMSLKLNMKVTMNIKISGVLIWSMLHLLMLEVQRV
jgi:hypothetical protein